MGPGRGFFKCYRDRIMREERKKERKKAMHSGFGEKY
jgi:hypothetical protein